MADKIKIKAYDGTGYNIIIYDTDLSIEDRKLRFTGLGFEAKVQKNVPAPRIHCTSAADEDVCINPAEMAANVCYELQIKRARTVSDEFETFTLEPVYDTGDPPLLTNYSVAGYPNTHTCFRITYYDDTLTPTTLDNIRLMAHTNSGSPGDGISQDIEVYAMQVVDGMVYMAIDNSSDADKKLAWTPGYGIGGTDNALILVDETTDDYHYFYINLSAKATEHGSYTFYITISFEVA